MGPCSKGRQKLNARHEELRNRTEAMGSGGPRFLGCLDYREKANKPSSMKPGTSVKLPPGNTWATAARGYRAPEHRGEAVLYHQKHGGAVI